MTNDQKKESIEGFDGVILHPAFDIKDGILTLGFRYRDKSKKMKPLIAAVHNGAINLYTKDEVSITAADGKNYFIERGKRLLLDINERWSLKDLSALTDELQDVTVRGIPKNTAIFKDLEDIIRRHVELEQEIDYALVAAWTMGTYFHRVFSAFPFLHAKGPKGSGKSQLLDTLNQLAFNAVKARPTLAALGDTVETLHGTMLIDEAGSLARDNNEELVETLAGSYKKNGFKRRVTNFDKKRGRETIEFETFSPKAFASTKELPENVRDRCLTIPLIRSARNLSDPNDDSPLWLEIRSKLYRFLIGTYQEVESEYVIRRAEYRSSNHIAGRNLEMWLPFETMLRISGASEEKIGECLKRFRMQYQFTQSDLGELDVAIIDAVLVAMGMGNEIVLRPKDIASGLVSADDSLDPVLDPAKTDRQKAGLVGSAVKRMNLADEKLGRDKHGERYRFTREKVERIKNSYCPTPPTPTADIPDVLGIVGGVESDREPS